MPLDAVVLTGGVILEEGEPADSPRAIAQAGPRAAMLLHRAADAALMGLPTIATIPPMRSPRPSPAMSSWPASSGRRARTISKTTAGI